MTTQTTRSSRSMTPDPTSFFTPATEAAEAQRIVGELEKSQWSVASVTQKEKRRYPAPPFTTSKLQQAAYNKLRFTAKRTMALDQVEVMKHFGFERFTVFGHDRGARVTHRLALDHPEKVERAAIVCAEHEQAQRLAADAGKGEGREKEHLEGGDPEAGRLDQAGDGAVLHGGRPRRLLSRLPYAGPNRIRFEGVISGLQATPAGQI